MAQLIAKLIPTCLEKLNGDIHHLVEGKRQLGQRDENALESVTLPCYFF